MSYNAVQKFIISRQSKCCAWWCGGGFFAVIKVESGRYFRRVSVYSRHLV